MELFDELACLPLAHEEDAVGFFVKGHLLAFAAEHGVHGDGLEVAHGEDVRLFLGEGGKMANGEVLIDEVPPTDANGRAFVELEDVGIRGDSVRYDLRHAAHPPGVHVIAVELPANLVHGAERQAQHAIMTEPRRDVVHLEMLRKMRIERPIRARPAVLLRAF